MASGASTYLPRRHAQRTDSVLRKLFRPDSKPRCGICGLHRELCGCEALPEIPVSLTLTFLQHPEELRKSTNTVRLARRLCPALGLVPWEGRLAPSPLETGTLLVFPASGAPVLTPKEVRDGELAILDGTWAQASRMYRVLEAKGHQARRLPEDLIHVWETRRSSRPERMSSAHAASLLLGMNGEDGAARALVELVDRVGEGFARMRGVRSPETGEKTVMEDPAIENRESRFPDRS